MAKGIHVEVFIVRDDGHDVSFELHQKVIRKIVALLERLGCTAHGSWRLGDSPDVEDQLG